MSWTTWVLFGGLLWSYPVYGENQRTWKSHVLGFQNCLKNQSLHFLIVDNFSGSITTYTHWNLSSVCILFLPNMTRSNMSKTIFKDTSGKIFLQMEEYQGSKVLRFSKDIQLKRPLYLLEGRQCNSTQSQFKDFCNNSDSTPDISNNCTGCCKITCLNTVACKQSRYGEPICNQSVFTVKDGHFINITSRQCFTCNKPVTKPEDTIKYDSISETTEGKVSATEAAGVMKKMANLAASINGSSATVTMGGVELGILVKQTHSKNEISVGYQSQNGSIYVLEGKDIVSQFSRSVTVSNEAFEKAKSLNVSVPFAAVFRFINLVSDEKNSTLLGEEVLAVEMGTNITNLTDKISINFKNVTYEGNLSCHSWNGVGSRPKWTKDGCLTKTNETTVTCECSHLTFFALLLAPPNQTISASDLNNLTIITKVGCGLSVAFLSIVLFMHFLLRKTKASTATKILIQLVLALMLLNLTFLINDSVAKLKNSVGCKMVAALMHYFMLSTFTWFAVQAFHLCLNLYQGGKIVIRHYLLKVSIISWVLPSVVGIVLLILGKYGEQVISTNDNENLVTMCWITDSNVHYIVNIGYYGLVFLFTFTTFIIVVTWLIHLNVVGSGKSSAEMGTNRKGISIILGLCCMMGITWGFAFFAYGILQIPAYYIFTILNSFQGFFLFLYYYNTSHSGETLSGQATVDSTKTVQGSLHSSENPYDNYNKVK